MWGKIYIIVLKTNFLSGGPMKKSLSLVSLLLLISLAFLPGLACSDDEPGTTPSSSANASSSLSSSSSSSFSKPPVTLPLDTKIKIASFNTGVFGTTKLGRSNTVRVLAQIATNFDLMAVQEIGSNSYPSETSATTVMNTYVAKINEIAGAGTYAYVRGHQYAFVYRVSVITNFEYHLYAGTELKYPPLIGHFGVVGGNFYFALITAHTSPTLANGEIPALRAMMSNVRAAYGESDVICLGDYNADGSYYNPGSTAQGWLNGFDNTTFITGIPNGSDSTVSVNNAYTYDRMQMFRGATAEDSVGTYGVLRMGTVYDISLCEGPDPDGTESNLSDHYPVWADFWACKDQD